MCSHKGGIVHCVCHPLFTDYVEKFTSYVEKFTSWEAQGITTLEPNGELLATVDEVDLDDDEAVANLDDCPLPTLTPTLCDSVEVYMNGGRLQY